jgi:hypothetical protein
VCVYVSAHVCAVCGKRSVCRAWCEPCVDVAVPPMCCEQPHANTPHKHTTTHHNDAPQRRTTTTHASHTQTHTRTRTRTHTTTHTNTNRRTSARRPSCWRTCASSSSGPWARRRAAADAGAAPAAPSAGAAAAAAAGLPGARCVQRAQGAAGQAASGQRVVVLVASSTTSTHTTSTSKLLVCALPCGDSTGCAAPRQTCVCRPLLCARAGVCFSAPDGSSSSG